MKSKKLNKKNIKLISAIILVVIMIVVLFANIFTNDDVDKLSQDYTIKYIETLNPGIKHDILLKKDGNIEISSIIKSNYLVEEDPIIKNINFSEKNTKNVKEFILSYFKNNKNDVTINASDIYETKEKYLLESIVYNCEKCFELEYNKYKNKIYYAIDNNIHHIYLLKDNTIKISTTFYNEQYNIINMESYDIVFSKKSNDEIVKLFKELFKDKKEKEQYINSYHITSEQKNILLAIINLNENYLYTAEEVENQGELEECVENCLME